MFGACVHGGSSRLVAELPSRPAEVVYLPEGRSSRVTDRTNKPVSVRAAIPSAPRRTRWPSCRLAQWRESERQGQVHGQRAQVAGDRFVCSDGKCSGRRWHSPAVPVRLHGGQLHFEAGQGLAPMLDRVAATRQAKTHRHRPASSARHSRASASDTRFEGSLYKAQPLQRGVIEQAELPVVYATGAAIAQQESCTICTRLPASGPAGHCVGADRTPPFLIRRARKLLHVLAEGLRCQLQPFDHGQVGAIGRPVRTVIRLRMASTAVWIESPASGYRLHADELSVTFLDDQSDEAVCVEAASDAARYPVLAGDCRFDPVAMRFRLAVAHGGDLRSVNTTAGIVRSRAASPPVMSIAARVPAAAATYELRLVGAVASRGYWLRDCPVDDDGPAIHGYPAASNASCARSVSGGGDEQLSVRNSPCVVVEHEFTVHMGDLAVGVLQHPDCPGTESGCHRLADGRASRKNKGIACHGRDLAAQPGKACASSSATTDEPITARRSGRVACQGSVEVQ